VERGQLNPVTPAAGVRAIHTDRQGQGARACASDRARGLSAPPFRSPCPAFLRQRDDEDGEAPHVPVFVQVVGGRAGWDEETEEKHVNFVHSSATPRALWLSPLVLLPLPLTLLSRSPLAGAAGRLTSPAMPAARLRNHATPTAHLSHTSYANCVLFHPCTRQLALERRADSWAVR
jgi:hypothetical protein